MLQKSVRDAYKCPRFSGFARAGLLLFPHNRCGAYARWRLAEALAERAIEMRNITKADPKRDIDDRRMQMVWVSQHREGTLKSASSKVLGEWTFRSPRAVFARIAIAP